MNNKRTIGVIGGGFVGRAIARGFNLFANVKLYDIQPERASHTFEETVDSDFVFLCLPTPMNENGEADISAIDKFFLSLSEMSAEAFEKAKKPIYIVKSTVPIGTTQWLANEFSHLKIVHNPEFLTARSACLDFVIPARHVVGGEPELRKEVVQLLSERFPAVPCFEMTSDESEFVKYCANSFFATKVLFFNEMRLLADKMGLDWDSVLQGVLSDGRIAKSHTDVPGSDRDYGVGGICLPKDLNALINIMKSNGIDPKILEAVWSQNKEVRSNWDWLSSPSAFTNHEKQNS